MKAVNILLVVFAVLAVAIGVVLVVGAASNPAMVTGQITNSPAQNSTSTTNPTASVPPSIPTTPSQGATYEVSISGFTFSPQTITINAGDSIRWTNMDIVSHTIVSDSGNMINSPNLAQGQSYTQVFTTPGTYTYHCSIHPMMKGTIIVNSPGSSATTIPTSSSSSGSSSGGGY